MLSHRPAPQTVISSIKRRLEKSHPGAQLVEDSVKLCAIPGTHFDATLFIFVLPDATSRCFVAELGADRGDTPHIYNATKLPKDDTGKEIAKIMLESILGLAKTIASDSRFRPRIITLNGRTPSSHLLTST